MRSPYILFGSLACALLGGTAQAAEATPGAVVKTYADIAAAVYGDALTTGEALQASVASFLKAPSEAGLNAARDAWRAARVVYPQTEAYRFGNPLVDEWEGRVNSWPLDEGLIDYVDAAAYGGESPENAFYAANVIANPKIKVGTRTVDATRIDKGLLEKLQEIDQIEANVSRGYHAVEFMLWGQDLNGTGPGAGERPWTDYSLDSCTNGHCDRRRDYLKAATDLLVADLREMADDWTEGGAARKDLVAGGPAHGLSAILTGLGSLSYGELAGERMQLGLLLNDPEEEQDCFSDNTYNSHYYDQVGMVNVARGRYERVDGGTVEGPSVLDLLRAKDPKVATALDDALKATSGAMTALKARGDSGEAYDQMIGPDNPEGNAAVQAVIDRLKTQAQAVEKAVAALDLGPVAVEGSDSLDDPNAVFQ